MCNIPLLRPALRILEKYAEYRAATGRLLPVPSNQKMNAYLKELATLCGVAKNLTTHCARHWHQKYLLNDRYLQKSAG